MVRKKRAEKAKDRITVLCCESQHNKTQMKAKYADVTSQNQQLSEGMKNTA
jgi:hypothetical protein